MENELSKVLKELQIRRAQIDYAIEAIQKIADEMPMFVMTEQSSQIAIPSNYSELVKRN